MTEELKSDISQFLRWLQLVIDRLPQTIFWKDINSNFLGCDRNFANLAGLHSPEDIIGKSDYDLPWTKEEADFYRECDRRVMDNNAPEYGIIETLVDKNGNLTWLETNKIPLHDLKGNVIGILGTFEDITERKLAEEKIQQSLRKLADFQLALIQSAIVSIVDTNGAITYVNDRFCEISQYSSPELIGKTHQIVNSGYHSPEFWQHFWRTIEAGEIWQGEICDRAKDGSLYWVNATIIPSLDKDNQPIQYLEILEDINERKKAEAALAYQVKKTELLSQITQTIHQSLDTQEIFHTVTTQIRQFLQVDRVNIFQLHCDLNLIQNKTENIVGEFMDRRDTCERDRSISNRLKECCFDTYRAVNYQQGEALAIDDIYTADLHEKQQKFLKSLYIRAYLVVPLLKGAKLWGLLCIYQFNRPRKWQKSEIEFMQKIATKLCIALYQAQLLEQEKQQRILLDRQNQQLRQSKEEAEKANLAKSSFLANMSHELRTPLNAILGFSQVMYRDATATPQQKETLRIINQSGEHLLALINDVLEVTKIEAGITDIKLDNFDLYHLLDSLQEMLRFKAEQKGLQLIIERARNVPPYIQSDRGKIRQILINLIGNAIKFTPKGTVKLTITATLERTRHLLCFTVCDTGVGISPTEVKNLFEPFVQTAAGVRSNQGTGLGLSIGRKFARLLGGDITVSSTPGIGSNFIFTLPAKSVAVVECDRADREKVIALAPGQPKYRILVVDDKKTNRLLLRTLLSAIGFEVEEAANGKESIEQWWSWQPDLIFMDIHMPVMNGIDATIKIKASAKERTIPVIALTASAFEERKLEILQAGCDDFLSKPIKDTFLFDKIAQYLPVTYIYEKDSTEIDAIPDSQSLEIPDLSFMSDTWLQEVHRAACQLDNDLLIQLIDKIPPERDEIKKALTYKIENFDFDVILQLTS